VKAKGAALKATKQHDRYRDGAGKCFFDMLGVFAEFETNLRKERQLDGIAKAKESGVYKGRPACVHRRGAGASTSKIAETLGIGRASVYRALAT
jgi:DNA invertase Pin-like site-specific DNA recombinase